MTTSSTPTTTPAGDTTPRVLARRRDDYWFGGVASGIAAYLGLGASTMRVIAFVAVLIAPEAAGFLVYVALWVALPVTGRSWVPSEAHRRKVMSGFLRLALAVIVLAVAVPVVITTAPFFYDSAVAVAVVGVIVVVLGSLLLMDFGRNAPVETAEAADPVTTRSYGGVSGTADVPVLEPRTLGDWAVRVSIAVGLLALVISNGESPLIVLSAFTASLGAFTIVGFVRRSARRLAFVSVPLAIVTMVTLSLGMPINRIYDSLGAMATSRPDSPLVSHAWDYIAFDGDQPMPRDLRWKAAYGVGFKEVTFTAPENDRNARLVLDVEMRAGQIEIFETNESGEEVLVSSDTGVGLTKQMESGDGSDVAHVEVRGGLGKMKVVIDRHYVAPPIYQG